MTTRTLFCVAAALGMLVAQAGAAPYWIAYEGNDFPEIEGGTRNINAAGGANRWIEDGALVIDSLDNAAIWDNYDLDAFSVLGPGERFIAEWRMLSEETLLWYDAGVTIGRTFMPGHIRIMCRVDDILVTDDAGSTHIPIAPSEWHVYRVESDDMVAYTLSIDGNNVRAGVFEDQTFIQSVFGWGDKVNGAASLTAWDYVRFGVVPEPQSLIYCVLVALAVCCTRRR